MIEDESGDDDPSYDRRKNVHPPNGCGLSRCVIAPVVARAVAKRRELGHDAPMMRRVVAVAVVLSACAATPDPGPGDAGETPIDAGASPDAGADATVLPENPTLEQLSAWWEVNLACRVFACEHRLRQNETTCALALAAEGIPYDTFRRALASVQAGRATYDAAAGRTCAAILRTIPLSGDCFGDEVVTYREAYGASFFVNCADLLTGTVAPGGDCDDEVECAPGGGCVFNRREDCSGTCVEWIRTGQSCAERPQDCVSTAYCDGTTCKSRNLAPDGSTCFDDGESCRSGKCFDFQCRSTSPYDGECVEDDDCNQGLYCRPLPPSTGQLGICKQPVLETFACGLTVDCAGNQTCAGYFQKYLGGWTEGHCGGAPNDVNDDCVPIAEGYDFGDTGCYSDLLCDAATSTCVEAPAVGAACAGTERRCGFRAFCDAGGVCRTKKRAGEAAESRDECLDDFDSFGKTCYRQADRARCGRF